MTTRKVKGSGSRINNSISLGQKIKLAKWVESKSGDDRSYHDLAITATAELGFSVTPSQMQNFWHEVNGRRNAPTRTGGLVEAMNVLSERLRKCELAIEQLNTEVKYGNLFHKKGE